LLSMMESDNLSSIEALGQLLQDSAYKEHYFPPKVERKLNNLNTGLTTVNKKDFDNLASLELSFKLIDFAVLVNEVGTLMSSIWDEPYTRFKQGYNRKETDDDIQLTLVGASKWFKNESPYDLMALIYNKTRIKK